MDESRKQKFEELKTASPLESIKLLQEIELYDAKSSQEIIDEVYEQFASGENIKDELLKPVFMSIIDGLLEATSGGRAARKKGLTASRVVEECESFSYDEELTNTTTVDAFTEYKNIHHADIEYNVAMKKWIDDGKKGPPPEYKGNTNENMTQNYERKKYEDKGAMDTYKKEKVKAANGAKNLENEYTGEKNITAYQYNPDHRRNDPTHRQQGQPDHIVPLKQIHDKFKKNYALDDSDIKSIANIDSNLALTSAEINQVKKEMTNEQYVDWMDEHGKPVDETTRKKMLAKQKEAEKAIDAEANKTILNNLTGHGIADKKAVDAAVNKFKEENGGRSPTKEERQSIEKKIQKEKTAKIQKTTAKEAANQAKDYAVGNLILFIVKPIYFELGDIFKNGLQEGVGASSGIEAIKIRFGRISKHVTTHAAGFLGDNLWDFVKGFVSSLIEGIISLFVGMLKQILKIIKEGVKIFTQSVKILFGEQSKNMSPSEKGDAIVKLLGGSVIAIAGIGIEALLNKIGIGEPWSIVLSTMLSGIASALFMYLLDKVDLFSVKAEKRRNRIIEIFDERISDINEATTDLDQYIDTLTDQRNTFENILESINVGLKSNNIDNIHDGLDDMGSFMGVDTEQYNIENLDSKTSFQF